MNPKSFQDRKETKVLADNCTSTQQSFDDSDQMTKLTR